MKLNLSIPLLVVIFLLSFSSSFAQEKKEKQSFSETFKDTLDGKFDVSDWLTNYNGFVPIIAPITEPAVDYGVALSLMFLHRNKKYPKQPPGISVIGGGYMFNESWVAFAFHRNSFYNDKIRYVGALGYGSINLDFYRDILDRELKVGVNIRSPFIFQRVTFKIPKTKLFAGAGYMYGNTTTKLTNTPSDIFDDWEKDLRLGSLKATLFWDSRDNTFTPNKGAYIYTDYGFYEEWLGSDFVFQDFNMTSYLYTDWVSDFVLSLRVESKNIIGGAPFFALPFISMRGIPAMRHQGNYVIDIETEERWDVTRRMSFVGFIGGGFNMMEKDDFSLDNSHWAGGAGIRYLMASWYNFYGGFDIAYGEEGPAFYVTIGSAWKR